MAGPLRCAVKAVKRSRNIQYAAPRLKEFSVEDLVGVAWGEHGVASGCSSSDCIVSYLVAARNLTLFPFFATSRDRMFEFEDAAGLRRNAGFDREGRSGRLVLSFGFGMVDENRAPRCSRRTAPAGPKPSRRRHQ
jgi:hypothetical protein